MLNPVPGFKVTSAVCKVLNGYTPAGFEPVVKSRAKPAGRRELPPKDFQKLNDCLMVKLMNNDWAARAGEGGAHTTADPRSVRGCTGQPDNRKT